MKPTPSLPRQARQRPTEPLPGAVRSLSQMNRSRCLVDSMQSSMRGRIQSSIGKRRYLAHKGPIKPTLDSEEGISHLPSGGQPPFRSRSSVRAALLMRVPLCRTTAGPRSHLGPPLQGDGPWTASALRNFPEASLYRGIEYRHLRGRHRAGRVRRAGCGDRNLEKPPIFGTPGDSGETAPVASLKNPSHQSKSRELISERVDETGAESGPPREGRRRNAGRA